MTHVFTVGEYKTKGGFNAVVLEMGPDDTLFGREQRDAGGYWYAKRWTLNGKNMIYQSHGESDLVLPKQEIWMVSWITQFGETVVGWAASAKAAKTMATCNYRTPIAVTGPHLVPA